MVGMPFKPHAKPMGGASTSDMLTAQKNTAAAVNNAAQTYLNVQGVANKCGLTAATLVKSAPGRICTVVVLVAGSANGAVYDASSAAATTHQSAVIPMTVGPVVLNMPCQIGIVVAPGTGQTVSVSYS